MVINEQKIIKRVILAGVATFAAPSQGMEPWQRKAPSEESKRSSQQAGVQGAVHDRAHRAHGLEEAAVDAAPARSGSAGSLAGSGRPAWGGVHPGMAAGAGELAAVAPAPALALNPEPESVDARPTQEGILDQVSRKAMASGKMTMEQAAALTAWAKVNLTSGETALQNHPVLVQRTGLEPPVIADFLQEAWLAWVGDGLAQDTPAAVGRSDSDGRN